jgi:hypothetical protein
LPRRCTSVPPPPSRAVMSSEVVTASLSG